MKTPLPPAKAGTQIIELGDVRPEAMLSFIRPCGGRHLDPGLRRDER